MTGAVRRVGWSFFDQVLSSGTNFVLSAFVAATISAAGFGAFTVVYGVYNVLAGISGGLVSIPLIVRFSAVAEPQLRTATRAAVGSALALGTLAGVICLALVPLTTPAIGRPLLALGVTLPGLLTQDAWRYSFVAAGRPARAAANDGLWAALQIAGIVVLLALHAMSAQTMVFVWGGSATAAAVFGCWQTGLIPAPGRVLGFLHEHRALAWRYAAEAVVHRSGDWLAVTLVGAVAGLRTIGALRGAVLILGGPLNLLFIGSTFAFVSEGVRLLERSPSRFPRAMLKVTLTTTSCAVVWSAIVLLLPDAVGHDVLGATWHQAQPLLPLLVLAMVAVAASMGPAQGMLSLGAARRSLFTQVVPLCMLLPSMTAGALFDGARGAALVMGVTSVFRTLLAWIQFRRALAEYAPSGAGEPALEQATLAVTPG